ncbi:MAG: hypothetical protein PHP23_06785 [Desulfobacterales bacterium]|nr:hypothetical protein [Desulfobacterales bacterium]MDD4073423.1 hypothetical protein [Desulfobacterales bacterium]MDD4393615.1 hypothetical protein [Desulfobacterales bacterium]
MSEKMQARSLQTYLNGQDVLSGIDSLNACFRKNDLLCRYAGEKIAVIFPTPAFRRPELHVKNSDSSLNNSALS